MTPAGRRAVLWDRDGTLMDEVDYCGSPERVRAVPGAGEALDALRAAGWLNLVITNQSGIGRGYFSEAEYEAVNAELWRQLRFVPDGVYCAPEHPDAPSARRKPGTGMVEEAARDHALDLSQSFVVGDKTSDIACGRGAGCRTVLVLTGYGPGHRESAPDFVVEDAVAAARLILELENGR
jgi:D-glycero-D-manno-heptose 1,7-bisphosphate phosphatase